MNETFETYHPYLLAIAYRMLGSAMDAEDMVQETFLRYRATAPETIHSLKAYLTTIISRLCVDQLQLARHKREQYLGPWLPERLCCKKETDLLEWGETSQRGSDMTEQTPFKWRHFQADIILLCVR
jgi:RNA polymerase sigma-70 factor (ECF subfamily)